MQMQVRNNLLSNTVYSHEECVQCTFNRPTIGHNTLKIKRAVTHTSQMPSLPRKTKNIRLPLGKNLSIPKCVIEWQVQSVVTPLANLLIHFLSSTKSHNRWLLSCQMHLINQRFNAFYSLFPTFFFRKCSSQIGLFLTLLQKKSIKIITIKDEKFVKVCLHPG